MPQINQLTATDTLDPGDLVPVFDQSSGDARKAAMSVLLQYVQDNIVFPSSETGFTTQYAAPSLDGFNIQITNGSSNIHLILTPTAGFSTGAITLPSSTVAIDRQEVLVNCTQLVTTFTVNGNGAIAVTGEPSSIGADDFFRLKYDAATSTWYRIG